MSHEQQSLTVGSLCSGAAGLDLAVADALGPVRTAWVAENDPDASRVLAERVRVPNVGDLTAVDWSTVEPVDVLVAGFPCQPFSVAGKRKGTDDERWIWPGIAAAVRDLRPRLVMLENPPGILAPDGIGRVVGDLAGLGYVGSWRGLRASDLGAPHQRKRIFIVAADPDREPVRPEPVAVGARVGAAVVGGDSPRALMPTPVARDWKGTGYSGQLGTALLPTPTAMDAHGSRNATLERDPSPTTNVNGWTLHDVAYADRWAQYGPAIARWKTILGRPAPEPTVVGKRGGRRLSGRFVEWLMGWPDGWVTDLVDNTAALRLCGNGVVRQQGAAAFQLLSGAP